ncbi:hypothetical protein BVI434_280026 [Burkholderia vietnamiensis]|nr:hypothetical protein BVI434_280026 [Burkholderia vietnamiensis]
MHKLPFVIYVCGIVCQTKMNDDCVDL